MKTLLLKIALPRLALYLADHRSDIIRQIVQSISAAEIRFPTEANNSHRAARLNWVRQRAATLLRATAPWALNCIIEMLIAQQRLAKGGPQ